MSIPGYYLGIDPSATCTGISIISTNNSAEVMTITPGSLRDCKRLEFISNSLSSFIADKKILMCCIETPAYGAVHKEFILGEVLGAIKLTLTKQLKCSIIGVAPTQVKKFMAGTGKADKSLVSECAVKDGCPDSQNDITDSWALARVAQSLYSGVSWVQKRASVEVISELSRKNSIELNYTK
jgi:Holliday junction resolvasome RuvABC endonuclease subunit